MKKLLRTLVAALLLVGGGAALADYTILDSASVTRTVKSFVCETTKICPSHVLTKSDGTEVGTASAPLRTDPTGTTTQPVSLASVPSHAVTNAGTFAVQAAATQTGTWTVQPGNTANTTAWKVDGSAVTQPVSIASVPSHAVTNAGTFAVQAAATQSGTWTVQPGNTANTTAWKVDGSAVTQPISGSITANAGTNLNTSALATSANQTNAAQKTQIVDGAGAVIASTSNKAIVYLTNHNG